jgi:trk system potassium uptake protein TrkH
VATKSVKSIDPVPPLAADREFGKELVNWLFPAYVTLIVLSVFLFLMKSMMAQGNAMSFDRAVLAAVNAATLTGFQQKTGPNFFKAPGQILVVLLTISGSLFSLIAGGLAVKRITRVRFSDRQVVYAACVGEIAAIAIGAFGGCGIHQTFLGGISQGASTFGNSGVALGHPFEFSAWQTHLMVLPMVFLGGLGITVLMELYDLLIHARPLSIHARTALTWSVGVYLVGVGVLSVLQWIAPHVILAPEKVMVASSVISINSRTAGIPFEYGPAFPAAMRWAVILLMMIGAASGGTGGGLKVTTLAVLAAGVRSLLRGGQPGRPLGIAMSWLGAYLAIVLLGLIMLLFVEPQLSGEQVLYLTISALSNVGLSHDQLPDMPRGAFVLAALMMAGRMVPMLVLWWMADTTEEAEIAVG